MSGHHPFKDVYKNKIQSCIKYGDFILHSNDKTTWNCDLMEIQDSFNSIMTASQLDKSFTTVGIMTGGAFLAYAHNPQNSGIINLPKNEVYLPGYITNFYNPESTVNGLVEVNLVDDVVTTESSIKKAIALLKDRNVMINEIFTILDRRYNPKLNIRSLFTPKDFDLKYL